MRFKMGNNPRTEAEKWIREKWLPKQFKGVNFIPSSILLLSGGSFKFDAVSEDRKIAVVVSTSKASTGADRKIYKDFYFLLLAQEVEHRVAVCTQKCLFAYFQKQQKCGRVHPKITLLRQIAAETRGRGGCCTSEIAGRHDPGPRK